MPFVANLLAAMTTPAKIRRRVLVVDDDRALNVGLVGLLKTFGHTASGVYDGASAVKRVDRGSFDLVLLDLGLPKIDGLEVLKHLRKNQPSLKIIIMTADDTPQTVLRVVQEQAYQFISKPTPPKQILEVVAAGALWQPEFFRSRWSPQNPIGWSWWFPASSKSPIASRVSCTA